MYRNFYNMTSGQLDTGDWMAAGVKVIIVEHGTGEKHYRLYRVRMFAGSELSPPQGERILPREQEIAVAEILFPYALLGMKPDPY